MNPRRFLCKPFLHKKLYYVIITHYHLRTGNIKLLFNQTKQRIREGGLGRVVRQRVYSLLQSPGSVPVP